MSLHHRKKLLAISLIGMVLLNCVNIPVFGSGSAQENADLVKAQIAALPDTYEGISLINGNLEEFNYSLNALPPVVDTSVTFEGLHPVKVTTATPATPGSSSLSFFGKDFSQPLDLSNLQEVEMLVWFYGDNPRDTLQGLRIMLQSGSGYFYTSLSSSYWSASPGVCRIRVGLAEMSKSGSPSLSNITGVRMRMYGQDAAAESVGVFNVTYNAKSKPKVILTFDDGWQDNYDYAYPILQPRGIKGTVYTCSDFIQSSFPYYMKPPTLTTLYNAGWDIANHTKAHQNYLSGGYTTQAMLGYYQTCMDYLLGLGFARSARFVAYPSGQYDEALLAGLKGIGIVSGRATNLGPNAAPFVDLYKLRQMTIGSATTFGVDTSTNDIKANIDRAVATGQTLAIMMHRVVPDSQMGDDAYSAGTIKTSVPMLTQVADYLVSLGVETCTMSEWYAELSTTKWLTLADKPAVTAARTAYSALSAEAKVLVTNYSVLNGIEAKMAEITANAAASAVERIKGYAAADNADALTMEELTNAGATKLVAEYLPEYKAAIAQAAPEQADTAAEIQAIVNTVNTPAITIMPYNSTTPTNQNIIVTAATNKGSLNAVSHTFTENGSFDFVATGVMGDVAVKTVTIGNIDKVAPIITIQPYNFATPTDQDITVFASVNEGTLNQTSHTFTENGSFTFSASDEAGNTAIVTITISNIYKGPKISLSVTGLTAVSKEYDGTMNAVLTGTGSLSGIQQGDEVSLSGAAVGLFADKAAGTSKTVTVTGLSLSGRDAGKYQLIPLVLQGDITKKTLTVTAGNKHKIFGQTNPAFTVVISGFVDGENISVLTEQPAAGCAANESSPAGDYDIIPSGGAAGNYTFTYVKGTLSILPASKAASVVIGSATAKVGTLVSIPVSIANNPGIAGFNIQLSYDSSFLELVEVTQGLVSQDFVFEKNEHYSENSVLLLGIRREDSAANGEIAVMTFRVKQTSAVPLVISATAELNNAAEEPISGLITNGAVTALQYILGDANGNGKVELIDAVIILRHIAALSTIAPENFPAADADGNGQITIIDAVRVLRVLAGLPT